jgi:hypothetical protein
MALWLGPPARAAADLLSAGLPCAPGVNVADCLLDAACMPDSAAMLAAASRRPVPEPGSQKHVRQTSDADSMESGRSLTGDGRAAGLRTRVSGAVELRSLLRRELLRYGRRPALLGTHIGVTTLLAVWLGLVYFHVKNNLAGFQNRAGAAFFSIISLGFSSLSALELFTSDRRLLAKEAGRYFRPVHYFVAKQACDLLLLRLLPAVLYSLLFYWLMGWQNSAHQFGVFVSTLMLTAAATGTLSVAVSMATPSVSVGTVCMTFLLLQMAIFGGFLSNTAAMPVALGWLRWLSVVFYAFESMLCNELHGLSLNFDVSGFVTVRDISGDSFLSTLNLDPLRIVPDILSLLALTLLFTSAGALMLTLRAAPPGGYRLQCLSRSRTCLCGDAAPKGCELADASPAATTRGQALDRQAAAACQNACQVHVSNP